MNREENLYHSMRPLYDLETAAFDLEYCELGKQWLANGSLHPIMIAGFLVKSSSGFHACSLDLSPISIYDPDFDIQAVPPDFDKALLKATSVAAQGVNNCVQEIFELGYILCPAEFFDALAFLHPEIPLPSGKNPILV